MQLSSIMPPASKQQQKKPIRLCDISVHEDSLHTETLHGHIRLFERTRMVGSQPRDETGIYLHIRRSWCCNNISLYREHQFSFWHYGFITVDMKSN